MLCRGRGGNDLLRAGCKKMSVITSAGWSAHVFSIIYLIIWTSCLINIHSQQDFPHTRCGYRRRPVLWRLRRIHSWIFVEEVKESGGHVQLIRQCGSSCFCGILNHLPSVGMAVYEEVNNGCNGYIRVNASNNKYKPLVWYNTSQNF